jgi:serine/threonine protein kinase
MTRLSTQQLTRMSRLLDEVIDADEAARRAWLQKLPEEHRDLEPALRQALLSPIYIGPPLDTLPRLAPTSGLQPGDRLGAYRLVRLLGSGGMAEVWLAQRADGAFRREVALKTPVRLDEREDLARRFAIERDILAALEHPRIARFYDAGVGDDGRPYLALEYVPGRNLLQWADERRLGLRERIELFRQVLDAVQYAHDKGVLHRDLKPGNVLVTDAGQVHLLDFGVARSIRSRGEPDVTGTFGPALTPAYASPEQFEGAEPDVASDVYSLGVMLYELLSGRRPHENRATERAGIVERPSARVDEVAAQARGGNARRIRRALSGELDAVVLKALSPLASQRYGSPAALAQDLGRYLAGEPVEAMGRSLPYRAAKWATRHRAFALQGGVAALVLAGIGYAMLGRQLPQRAQDAAAVAPAPAEPAWQHDRRAEARDLIAQGDVYANGPFERDAQRAEVAFRKAAALVPDDALPWAMLAHLHLKRAAVSPGTRAEKHAMAREAIETALQIDPRSMAAHAAAFLHAVRATHRWDDARAELDRMRMIDASDEAWLPACEARMAGVIGRLDEAVRIQKRIVERDPTNAAAAAALASYLFDSGRIEESMALSLRELQLSPHAAGTPGLIGVDLALLGKGELALAAIAKEADPVVRLWALSVAHWASGRRDESEAALAELRNYPRGNAYAIAQLYAFRGERDPAFEWLRRACLERQGGCENLKADRFLRSLRGDPRHRALLAAMKLDAEPPSSAR